MLLRSIAFCLCALSLPLAAVAAENDELPAEWQELQGAWKCIAREGVAFTAPPSGMHLLTIAGKQFKVEVKELPSGVGDVIGWGSNGGTFAIDPAQMPKHIDDKQEALHWLGIHRLENDKLTIAFRTIERPKSFDDRERTTLLTFERIKP